MSYNIEEKINTIDWHVYAGPSMYKSEELITALKLIDTYDAKNDKDGLINSRILYGLGNNHRGTYYPAVLEALDIIIEMEKNSPSKKTRICAYWVLHDLYHFEPELGSYKNHSEEYIRNFVNTKLTPYSKELTIAQKSWWQFWK